MFALLLTAALTGQVPVYAEIVTGGVAGPGTGQPLPGLEVTITGPGGVLARGTTDGSGRLYLPHRSAGVPAGSTVVVTVDYTISVDDMGNRTRGRRSIPARVGPGGGSLWINWIFDY
jgi:hypothetical protein